MDEHTQAGTEGLKYAAAKGLPVIIMEPLRGGRLVNALPKAAKAIFASAEPHRSPAEWGLRWIWNHPEVTVVLSGMNDIAQVEENVRIASDATADALTEKDLEIFEKVKKSINQHMKVPCTGCGYCMPCPVGIEINNCARMSLLLRRSPSAGHLSPEGQAKMKKIEDCLHCGACKSKCPYGLDTPKLLEENYKDYMEVLAGKEM